MGETAADSETTPEAVEIWFKIEKDAEGYPESQDWEELWATPLEGGRFRLDSTPFFVKDIAAGDVVSAVKTEEGFYRFEKIISRSGNSNFRIWLHDAVTHDSMKIVEALRELGCRAEITLERLIAIDVHPDRENEIWEYLEAGRNRDDWGLQVGFSPD
jgi:hypothetical protein